VQELNELLRRMLHRTRGLQVLENAPADE